MLSNFHRITSESWQRTSGTQKGSPISSKGGRTKYKRQTLRQKIQGQKPVLGRESERSRSLHTVRSQLTGVCIGSFRISEDNKTGREKGKRNKTTEYTPIHNHQWRSGPDAWHPLPVSGGWAGRCGLHHPSLG